MENKETSAIKDSLNRMEHQLYEMQSAISRLQGGNDDTIFTSAQAEEHLSISRKKLFNLRRRGKIGHFQVGRSIFYKRSDLQYYLEQHYLPANPNGTNKSK